MGEDGNDFIEINPDSATVSLLWLIASFSFVAFCAFALMFLIGSKRRKQQIQAKETKYCQQALQMSEYESESGCDSEQEAINLKDIPMSKRMPPNNTYSIPFYHLFSF